MATLIIHADIECCIYIDTEYHGIARAGTEYIIRLSRGAYWIECRHTCDESIYTNFDIRINDDTIVQSRIVSLMAQRREKLLSQYSYVGPFINGYAKVVKDRKIGFVNKNGEYKFDTISSYMEDVAIVSLDGKFGAVNVSGELIINIEYDSINYFINGQSIASRSGKFGIVDTIGNIIVPFQYDWIIDIEETYIVQSEFLFGLVAKGGEVLLPTVYKRIETYDKSIRVFTKYIDDEWSGSDKYMNNLVAIIPRFAIDKCKGAIKTYDSISYIRKNSQHHMMSLLNNKYGLISYDGIEVCSPKYDAIENLAFAYRVKIGDKYGLISYDGVELCKVMYDSISDVWMAYDEYKDHNEPRIYDGNWNADSHAYIVKYNDKYGLIGHDGYIICQPLYDEISSVKGAFIVKLNGKVGLIRRNGELILNVQYQDIYPINEFYFDIINIRVNNIWELCRVKNGNISILQDSLTHPVKSNTYCNCRFIIGGNIVIDTLNHTIYDIVKIDTQNKDDIHESFNELFPDGCSYVVNGNLYIGYNDVSAFPILFTHIEGRMLVLGGNWDRGRWDRDLRDYEYEVYVGGIRGWIRSNGTISIINYDSVHLLDDYISVAVNGKHGILSIVNDEQILPCEYDDICIYSQTIKKNGKFAKIDANYHKITPLKYDSIDGNIVQFNGKYGLIDIYGNEVMPIEYNNIHKISDYLYVVSVNNQYGTCDACGNTILPIIYSSIEALNWRNDDLLIVCQYGQYGVYDRNGKEVIPINYDNIQASGDYVMVIQEMLKGLYDKLGNKLLSCTYENIWLAGHIATIKKNGKYGMYNLEGKEYVIPLEYDSIETKNWAIWEGLYQVKKGDFYGIYNKEGVVVPAKYTRIELEYTDSQRILVVIDANQYNVYTEAGELIASIDYNERSKEAHVRDSMHNSYTFYDVSLYDEICTQKIIMLNTEDQKTKLSLLNIGCKRYDYQENYYGGLWLIVKDNKVYYACLDYKAYSKVLIVKGVDKWGCLNSKLETILPFVYDDISHFINGIAVIEYNGRYGAINEAGQIIHSCVYTEIITSKSERRYRSEESYSIHTTKFIFPKASLNDGNTTVYLSKEGDIIYNTIFERGNCVFIKGLNDRWAIYYEGNVTPYIYDAIFKDSEYYNKDKVRIHCKIGTKHGIVDQLGNIIIPFIYDKIEYIADRSNYYYLVAIASDKYLLDDQGVFEGIYQESLINDEDDNWDGNLMSYEDMYRAAFDNFPDAEWNID